jgi:hypothetical protein
MTDECTLQYFAGNHMGDCMYVTGTNKNDMGQPQIPLEAGQRRMFEVERERICGDVSPWTYYNRVEYTTIAQYTYIHFILIACFSYYSYYN